ncbi:hypothetical protein CENSYa_0385 [Cenarchaeum symbiosum A]|uniref:Uncharacterized protein n=1 Tax=Cenarchaeum symbiosum (strain A) TaxID=414004 RepID=A0RUK4_CENSY|nr:hypothetical protein CENSYa_0385 [Cenarchaeum symbiosum A]
MSGPLVPGEDGIKIKPELMETEKLYHCIFGDKVMLAFKDGQEVLHCYEIEEKEIVMRVKNETPEGIEGILEDYIRERRLND